MSIARYLHGFHVEGSWVKGVGLYIKYKGGLCENGDKNLYDVAKLTDSS